jgi:hypothetical protein
MEITVDWDPIREKPAHSLAVLAELRHCTARFGVRAVPETHPNIS